MRYPLNVLVFPARNEPGLETIQALSKSNKMRVFAGSSYESPYEPARHIAKRFIPCPGYDEPRFKSRLHNVIQENEIDVVFPMWDPLVAIFSEWDMPGVKFITPNPQTAKILLSKRETYDCLKGVVPVPKLFDAKDAKPPLFAKPDCDSGSRGTLLVTEANQLKTAVANNLLLCEFLPGVEYTVDCVSDMQGNLLFSNVRERSHIARGIALATRAVVMPEIDEHIGNIARLLKISGPWFAQFRENAEGKPVLMEINARVAGSMTLTRLCGVNIPLISVFIFTGHTVKIPKMKPVMINRCLRSVTEQPDLDAVVWDWDDTIIRKDGKPDPDVAACMFDLNNRGARQFLLTKNRDFQKAIDTHRIPDFFVEKLYTEDKMAALEKFFEKYSLDPRKCAIVNDSYSETFLLQARFPDLRSITPDAIDVLGREKI